MVKFRKPKTPEKQAKSIARTLQKSGAISSVRTLQNYQERYEQIAKNMALYQMNFEIREMTIEQAHQYLEIRGSEIGQKTLDMERQAIQSLFYQINRLSESERLDVIKSENKQILNSRAYTQEQINIISSHQSPKNALATEIAYNSGLRTHELLTLQKSSIRQADDRPKSEHKFYGRTGELYTVQGKGGLIREVLIRSDLAGRLEQLRLAEPQIIIDRNVIYRSHYNISGGKKLSNSFSKISKNHLGWSAGIHGLRHSYAQERMSELQRTLTREIALEVVSQELGHFRPEITEIYLR